MTLDEVFDGYLLAVREGSRKRAFDVIEGARADGHGLRELYLDVFQPALREIGRLWQENLLTVAEEHLATAITEVAMLRLYADLEVPEATGPLLIAACADTERHEIGLRMLCDFMELEGWNVLYLGTTVPGPSLHAMIRSRRPQVVALSASITMHLPQLQATIASVREGLGGDAPLFLVGGRLFIDDPGLVSAVGADLGAPDAARAAALLTSRFR